LPRTNKASIFDEIQSTRFNPGCSVKALRDQLDDEQRRQFDQALKDDTKFHSVIAEGLKRWGHNVSTGTISRHRKGMCSCGKQR